MKLTDVSKTAIATLRCHVIEAGKVNPTITDPMAKTCLDQLMALATDEADQAIFRHKLTKALTSHIALRARKYDAIINAYIHHHPGSTVINLGCGFDTRYWRIDHTQCTYIELDLPEVIALKQKALANHLDYALIGSSVLDPAWIEHVTLKNNCHFLLVAEGLLMYLPAHETIDLFRRFAARFYDSQIVFEAVTAAYTHGLWKKIVEMKIKAELGLDAGSSYQFGIQRGQDIEQFASGLKVIDEWSYVEDPDVYPKFLKYMKLERTQWTITAAINPSQPG